MYNTTAYRPVTIEEALNDFDRLLGSFFGESPLAPAASPVSFRNPATDVREMGDAYVLESELPGYDEKSIEVRVDGTTLSIESKEEEKGDEGSYVVRERRHLPFRRSFALPKDADTEAVTAVFRNGLLTLSIGKRAAAKRRTVKIEG